MYHTSPSTVSLNPVFPGHYPATPAKPKPREIPNARSKDDVIEDAYTENDGDISSFSDEDTSDDVFGYSPEAPSITLSSRCSLISIEPASTVESHETDTDSTRSSPSNASTIDINRTLPSVLDQTASSVHFRMSDLPSIRSEASTSCVDGMAHLVDPARCPSTLSLGEGVDLVGLPSPAADPARGVFLDGDSSNYYGVDLSCLSQPDGTNAWTLSLGPCSPFPSVSTSDETPQSGVSSTFSSPDVSTSTSTTHALPSPDLARPPSLSDYYGMDDTHSTPSYRTEPRLSVEDNHGEPSPPYEPASLILESVPYAQHVGPIVVEEPKNHFKEVMGDVKKLGSKLKKIWKTRPQLSLAQFKSKSESREATEVPPSRAGVPVDVDTYTPPPATHTTVPMRRSLDGPRGDYSWRTPPGLAQLVEEEEEDLEPEPETETTPKIAESRRKLFKPQTIAEIKHVRRRTLPATPLPSDDFAMERTSPIITITQRRPRPRSLVFSTSASTSQGEMGPGSTEIRTPLSDSFSSTTRSPAGLEPAALPHAEVGQPVLLGDSPAVGAAASRRRKRWSTGLAFFTRS